MVTVSNCHELKIRVANIIEEGKMGGPQLRSAYVARFLKPHIDVIIVIPEENSEPFRVRLDMFAIPYKTLKMSRITKELKVALRYIFCSLFEIVKLVRYLDKEKIDLVHASGGAWQYKGIIAGYWARKKIIWELNDSSLPSLFRWIFKVLSPLADGYVFASARTRNYYSSLIKRKKPEFLIPSPVDTSYFSPYLQYEKDVAETSEWDGKVIVGTVANINPIKGLDVLLKVAAQANKSMDRLIFVVVGAIHKNQRRLYEKLLRLGEKLCVHNVEFVGSRMDPRPILKRFDVYICTSYSEASPLSVWEAMSMGKVILSTNVGDVPLYVRNGESGEIIEVGDVETMSNKLVELIHNPIKQKEYMNRARQIAVKELDVSICAKKHLEVYQTIYSGLE